LKKKKKEPVLMDRPITGNSLCFSCQEKVYIAWADFQFLAILAAQGNFRNWRYGKSSNIAMDV
jgi:hypothetical protein